MESINDIARNNIKLYRKMRKMTQKGLAEALTLHTAPYQPGNRKKLH
jgi:transcriptional regulator with XRE-family HTH domain